MEALGCRVLAGLTLIAFALPAQSPLDQSKRAYQETRARLQPHVISDGFIDDAPESPALLAQQWTLAAEWVAAWLDAHGDGPAHVKAALVELAPDEPDPEYVALGDHAYVVAAPGTVGNVFIVAEVNGSHRVLWSTAQAREATGRGGEILSAWRPDHARNGGRGLYSIRSGDIRPILPPRLGKLSSDAHGRARFYIDGTYAQAAGGTVGAQISIWSWEGAIPRPLIARDYTYMVDQAIGTRLDGDLLKVQQKKSFRTFFACGQCDERQTDWVVRITPEGIDDLGEVSLVPELDAIDELFARILRRQPAHDIASPRAIRGAERIVSRARGFFGEKQSKRGEFSKDDPSLGMMGSWTAAGPQNRRRVCLELDAAGTSVATLRSAKGRFFVDTLTSSRGACRPRADVRHEAYKELRLQR